MGYGRWHTVIPLNTVTTSQQLYYAGGYVARVALRESTGAAPAVVEVYDGSGTNGVLIDSINLASGASLEVRFNPWDYPFDGGLYLSVVSGSVRGSFTICANHHSDLGVTPVVLINPEVLSVSVTPAQS